MPCSSRRCSPRRARVGGIDLARRLVLAEGVELPYDQLVLALGSVSQFLGLENVRRHAFEFKTLIDAITIRNHTIDLFERADRATDAQERRDLLTFVVAGGGFAGAELAGALNDFARGIVVDYPSLRNEDVTIVLVHSRDRILPELSESLAAYALERMRARGVTFRLKVRVKDASATDCSSTPESASRREPSSGRPERRRIPCCATSSRRTIAAPRSSTSGSPSPGTPASGRSETAPP